jgi:hypothetical protein
MASRSPSPSYYGAYRPQISEVCPGLYEEMLEERKNWTEPALPAFEGDVSHLMEAVYSLNYDKLGNPLLSGGLKNKKRAEEASKKLRTANDLLLDLRLHSSSHEDGMKIPHKLFVELEGFLAKLADF